MKAFRIALSKVFGLFVDDLYFTGAILAWVACSRVLLPQILPRPEWDAALLAGGCTLLLVGSALFHAQRARRRG